jgi:hypothetical protein
MPDQFSRFLLAAMLAGCLPAQAGEPSHDHHAAAPAGVEALSAPLREALSAEMVALQGGLMAVIPAVVAGHWDEVARIGAQMRDSYIMKQALTDAQLEELHDALPASFLELDARLHYLAGMLEHVAEARKPELVGYYLGAMTETCVACHARHAQAKFPALADAAPHDHQH